MTSPIPVQYATGQNNVTLASAPAVGSLLTIHLAFRNGAPSAPAGGGWTLIQQCVIAIEFGRTGGVYWRISDGTAFYASSASNTMMNIVEWPAGTTLDSASAQIDTQTALAFRSGGEITPTRPATVVGMGLLDYSDGALYDVTLEGGTTVLVDTVLDVLAGGFAPRLVAGYQTDKTGPTTVDGTMAGAGGWGGVSYAVLGPPTPGVWLDFAGDGFDIEDTSAESGLLARVYPEIASSSISDDITGYVKSLTWTRPGDPGHVGNAPGDSCTIIVRNDTGIFTTTNPSSPVYGVLRPGRPVWIGINGDGTLVYDAAQTVHGLFAGRVNKVVPMPQLGFAEAPEAQIIVDGIMTPWRRRRALVEFSDGRTVHDFRAAILASLGVDSDHYDLDDEDQWLLYSGIINTHATVSTKVKDAFGNLLDSARLRPRPPYPDALGLLEELCKITGTRHAILPADSKEAWYTYKTYNRDHKLASAVDASWTGPDITGMTGYDQSYDGVINFQDASYTPVVIDAQSRIVWEAAGPFAIHSNAPLAMTAEFGDYVFDPTLEYTRIGSGPPAITSYLTNYGDGALLSWFRTDWANIKDVRVRGRRVIRQDTQTYTKRDDASANDTTGYGERSGGTVQSDFLQTAGAAQTIADFLVWKFANPLAKPGINTRNRTDLTAPRQLYDVLGISFNPIHLSGRRFEITGMSGTISVNTDARLQVVDAITTLQETPNQAALNFFEIGVSTLGSGALLAP